MSNSPLIQKTIELAKQEATELGITNSDELSEFIINNLNRFAVAARDHLRALTANVHSSIKV